LPGIAAAKVTFGIYPEAFTSTTTKHTVELWVEVVENTGATAYFCRIIIRSEAIMTELPRDRCAEVRMRDAITLGTLSNTGFLFDGQRLRLQTGAFVYLAAAAAQRCSQCRKLEAIAELAASRNSWSMSKCSRLFGFVRGATQV